MNKTDIEYGTHSWSPVRGCKHGLNVCATAETCWARGIATRFHRSFEPTFHPEALQQPLSLRHPEKSRILVCFTGDIGGSWVPQSWQEAVVDVIRHCPTPNFLLLTKNPSWYAQFNPWPANAWVGTSITGAETPERQGAMLEALHLVEGAGVRWVSLEPLLQPLSEEVSTFSIAWKPNWVVCGAQTGSKSIPPPIEYINGLRIRAQFNGIPLWEKRNLARYLNRPLVQGLP